VVDVKKTKLCFDCILNHCMQAFAIDSALSALHDEQADHQGEYNHTRGHPSDVNDVPNGVVAARLWWWG
jgi:hypothetical protein